MDIKHPFLRVIFIFLIIMSGISSALSQQTPGSHRVMIVIHGGAGTILKKNMSPEMEQQYREKLAEAINAGYAVLKKNGTAVDAVEATINIMEDSPLFNAGKGAVFTHEGTNEMDAAIMDGKTLKAGSVADVQHIKNPISLARMVMEKSQHVMLVGDGAETFAKQQGMQMMPKEYFYTDRRWKELQRALEEENGKKGATDSTEKKHGTVGCVALDASGNLAAGTSTGGLTNKRYGRVGDSPIIGAGTYADNATCGVSATGTGEYFIRMVVAHEIASLMGLKGMTVQQAADTVVMKMLPTINGDGGVIAMDANGNFAMPFNTPGMYRAYIDENGKAVVKIYKTE